MAAASLKIAVLVARDVASDATRIAEAAIRKCVAAQARASSACNTGAVLRRALVAKTCARLVAPEVSPTAVRVATAARG